MLKQMMSATKRAVVVQDGAPALLGILVVERLSMVVVTSPDGLPARRELANLE
jgi:hypothetical protein